jgi:hypothetical protein
MTPVDRARRAAAELIAAWAEARSTTEREDISRVIACLSPAACRTLSEMAEEALGTAREES